MDAQKLAGSERPAAALLCDANVLLIVDGNEKEKGMYGSSEWQLVQLGSKKVFAASLKFWKTETLPHQAPPSPIFSRPRRLLRPYR